jgi:outer membrane lipoprotein SlyB
LPLILFTIQCSNALKGISLMKIKLSYKIYSLVVMTALLNGCYSQGGWAPTVDAYSDPNAHRINQDMADCEQLAHQASGGTAKESAIGAGVGGLLGGATGAVVGAFTGNAGAGAAIGATAGALGGAAKQGFSFRSRI